MGGLQDSVSKVVAYSYANAVRAIDSFSLDRGAIGMF